MYRSDQGSQYTSIAFGLRCKAAGVRPSMGSVGDAYENVMYESFFATLECELLDRRKFRTKAEARMADYQTPSITTTRSRREDRPLANLRRIPCRMFSYNSSCFSQVGASGKPGAIQPPLTVSEWSDAKAA